MALLRLIADILCYLTLGLLLYWYLSEDTAALLIAIVSGVVSFLLFIITTDIRQSQRKRKQDREAYDIWDFWYLTDLLEIPFRMIIWLFKSLWRIFD
ncbi:hypothetical protein [Psychrobacter sp. Ps3]|uniref:hypothetical protein n=1 Tax=Psychrobacter sp. Ps3 TaxID=2790957 RepID=UPI001EE0319F|nr:hypothetical protein [Psychrobacter sp. Ps3]MCG3880751.1 hypothetical protein [Psychrobacter sp. Ps3]